MAARPSFVRGEGGLKSLETMRGVGSGRWFRSSWLASNSDRKFWKSPNALPAFAEHVRVRHEVVGHGVFDELVDAPCAAIALGPGGA